VNADEASRAKALFNPVRARILAMLAEERGSPTKVGRRLGITNNAAAYHFRVLERLGLIEVVDTRQVRGAHEKFYSPVDAGSDEAGLAGGASPQRLLAEVHRDAWTAAALGGFDRHDALIERKAPHLDERGWEAVQRATRAFLERVRVIEKQAERRIDADTDADETRQVGIVVLSFQASPAAVVHPEEEGQ
jgi:predicted ArsR family transcriptional regulator